jgi:glycosyltransferase involved in cell wall biosynthesis
MVSRRIWFRRGQAPREGGARGRGRAGSPSGWIGIDPPHRLDPAEPGTASTPSDEVAGKRILFINQYYWPDCASTAQHLTDLAESMAACGFQCHVLASRSRYRPSEPMPLARETRAGVQIHRVPATSLGRRGTWARMTDYLSFYAGALAKAFLLPRCDVVVTLTTPPLIGLIGSLLKRLRGTRHVYWSMDLHPDASLALRRMSPGSVLGRFMHGLSGVVYRTADKVVALGPYMADRIAQKQVPAERIATIPVWSGRDEIYPSPRAANPLRRKLAVGEKFVAMYSGNLGLAHSFDEFLEAARRLRHRSDILFLFAGGGPRLGEVKAAQERDQLTNVRLLDYVPRDQLHWSLALADVHLISMRPEMTGIVVPGKLYGAMAAGRPAIFVGPEHCEPADTIRNAGCGLTIKAGDVAGLIAAIELLASDPSIGRRMGERGRSALIAHHEQRLCCNYWFEMIRELIGPHGRSESGAISPANPHGHTARPAHWRPSPARVVPSLTMGR